MKWLHLSDIHFADLGFDVAKLRGALVSKLRALSPDLDFILITGDIFYRNNSSKNVIPDLQAFISDIAKACHVDRNFVYICQGNHDVNRCDSKRNTIVEEARKEDNFSSASYDKLIGLGNDSFRSLFRTVKKKEYVDYGILESKKHGARIITINSCLLSKDDNDYQNLRVCAPILEVIRKQLEKSDDKLNLVIMHHGIDWLHPKDAKSFEHWVEDNHIDAIFVGHTHQPNIVALNDVNRDIYQFTSGALMLDGYAIPSFFLCEEVAGLLTVKLYSYSDKTDSWELDNHNLRKFRKDGERSFILPRKVVKNEPDPVDELNELTCDEIINALNAEYELKYGSKRFVSDKTKEYEDFNAWKIFGSLVNIGVFYPVALRLCVQVVETVTSPDYPSKELLHSSTIKEVILKTLIKSHELFPELNEFDIGIWASKYARHYDKNRGFVLFEGGREEPISYNLLKTEIIKEAVVQITGNEIYYIKIPTSELERMSSEIMRFIKSLGISKINREILLKTVIEYVSEPPHPWFVYNNRQDILDYHKKNTDKHLSELIELTKNNPILQIEAAYHLFAAYLTIYDNFVGCTEISPIIILKNSIDLIGTRENDRLPMRRCLLMQLKDDLKEKGIQLDVFQKHVDTVYSNIVEARIVSAPETVEALLHLRSILSEIENKTAEEWKKTDNTLNDVKNVFRNAAGFIVKKPLQQFKKKAFFVSPFWDTYQIEQYGLGDNILVAMLDDDTTLDNICLYLSQERKRSIKEVVFFKKNVESFSPLDRKNIRDTLKKKGINVRCIFIQEPNFEHIKSYGWRREFFRILTMSRKSIW